MRARWMMGALLLLTTSCEKRTRADDDDGGSAPICSEAGDSCDDRSCCSETTCVEVPIDGYTEARCADHCSFNDECNSGCCAPVAMSTESVCAPAELCVSSVSAGGGSPGGGGPGGGAGGADPSSGVGGMGVGGTGGGPLPPDP